MKRIFFCLLWLPYFAFSQEASGDAEIDTKIKLAVQTLLDESKSDSLLVIGQEISSLGDSKNNEIGKMWGLRIKGLAFFQLQKYEEALKEAFKLLNLADKNNSSIDKLRAYGDIGNIYISTQRYDEAKRIFLTTTQDDDLRKKDPKRVSTFYTNLGVIYKRQAKLDSALLMYERSVALKELIKDEQGIMAVKTNLSILYAELGQYSKAKAIIEENIAVSKKNNNEGDLWHNLGAMGGMLVLAGDYPNAFKYLSEAKELAEKIDNNTFRVQSLDLLANYYEKTGNPQKALEITKEARVLSESYLNESTNNAVSELQEKYNAEERERENKILSQELVIERTRKYLLIGGLTLAILLGILAFMAFRKNQKINKKIAAQNLEIEELNTGLELKVQERTAELQQALDDIKGAMLKGQKSERKRIASDLHDNLGSVLSAINMNLEALDPASLTESEAKLYANVKSMTSDAYREVRHISHNLSPKELEAEGLEKAIYRLVGKLNQSGKINFELDYSLEERLPERLEVNFYSILLEMCNNIIKHSQATKAMLSLSRSNKTIDLSVSDNGAGFDTSSENGFGLNSIKQRVKELNGELQIESKQNQGSTVAIHIPV